MVDVRGRRTWVWCAGVLAGFVVTALAQAVPPTADEINKVMTFYNDGKDDGPVLIELTPCLKVDKKPGERTKSCVEPVTGPVAKKTVVNAFMRWFVPKGTKAADLDVQFAFDGDPRATKDFSIELENGSTGYGIWKGSTLSKPGEWEIRVRRGGNMVSSAKVTISE